MASDSSSLCKDDALENLKTTMNELNFLKEKNNWFHEYLVGHYKKKQMTHVCSEEPEDSEILDDYGEKLLEFDEWKAKNESDEKQWNAELEKYQSDILEKNQEAVEETKSMISRVKSVGLLLQQNGKPFSTRKTQNLLAKHLEKIKDVHQFRLSYMKLRNKLSLIEYNLKLIIASVPNLTKEDYERLESENFHYNYELERKKKNCCTLIERQNNLQLKIGLIQSKILEQKSGLQASQKILDDLKLNIKSLQKINSNLIIKLNDKKQTIPGFHDLLKKFRANDFEGYMELVHKDHEKWMIKISNDLQEIKRLGESLSAVKTNLILHGKNVEFNDNEDIRLLEKTIDKNQKKKNVN